MLGRDSHGFLLVTSRWWPLSCFPQPPPSLTVEMDGPPEIELPKDSGIKPYLCVGFIFPNSQFSSSTGRHRRGCAGQTGARVNRIGGKMTITARDSWWDKVQLI